MLKIQNVDTGSYASDIGIEPDDQLVSINGHTVDDLLDYERLADTETLTIEILKNDGQLWLVETVKAPGEDLGLCVEHPPVRQCGNQCIFCFVHQLPCGMRKSLYIKDEDYRFSYLYGSYITLTNLTEKDIARIIDQKLSPLYVSVHSVDQQVRKKLLKADVPDIKELIQRLTSHGIDLHCQVVLCPGVNDGSVLDETIEFLAGFRPRIKSLAVVPVGLTKHRNGLPPLESVTQTDARACLDQIKHYQDRFHAQSGSRFVFAADELFLKAGSEIPVYEFYEDFPQFENGVGMIAYFRQQATEVLMDADELDLKTVSLITGRSFYSEMKSFAERLKVRTGVTCQVHAIENSFFGESVTVTGLLTGCDIINQLSGKDLGQALLLPDIVMKDGQNLFLDDSDISTIENALGVPVVVVENSPWGVLDGMEQVALGPVEVVRCHDS